MEQLDVHLGGSRPLGYHYWPLPDDDPGVKLVRESDVLPAYYFPKEDVRADLFTPSTQKSQCPQKGEASYWTIRSAGKAAENFFTPGQVTFVCCKPT